MMLSEKLLKKLIVEVIDEQAGNWQDVNELYYWLVNQVVQGKKASAGLENNFDWGAFSDIAERIKKNKELGDSPGINYTNVKYYGKDKYDLKWAQRHQANVLYGKGGLYIPGAFDWYRKGENYSFNVGIHKNFWGLWRWSPQPKLEKYVEHWYGVFKLKFGTWFDRNTPTFKKAINMNEIFDSPEETEDLEIGPDLKSVLTNIEKINTKEEYAQLINYVIGKHIPGDKELYRDQGLLLVLGPEIQKLILNKMAGDNE